MISRITDVVAWYEAGTVAPCKAGDDVAIRFSTTSGEVVIKMREKDWVRGARGPRDYNGNKFRTVEQFEEERRQRHPEPQTRPVDAGNGSSASEPACATVAQAATNGSGARESKSATVADLTPAAPKRKSGGAATPERIEQMRGAWHRLISGQNTAVQLAKEIGVTTAALYFWFKRFRAEENAPVLKPSGRIA